MVSRRFAPAEVRAADAPAGPKPSHLHAAQRRRKREPRGHSPIWPGEKIRGLSSHHMAIEVRDQDGPILKASFNLVF